VPEFASNCCTVAVPLSIVARQQAGFRIRNWLPLVDALRTFLLDPTPDLRKTIDQVWFTGTTPRRRLA
jgi:hypothetical protein